MIIVSQNKDSIYNFDNVKSIDIIENKIYITDDILADSGALIAEYKTEERAKEVLQEILQIYRAGELLKVPSVTPTKAISGEKLVEFFSYEMPKE